MEQTIFGGTFGEQSAASRDRWLWQAAGEGRIKATALECKNAKAFDGDLIEIPAHYWTRLNRADDPSGKAMLSGRGRVYREVLFPRLDVKKLWPNSAGPPG